MIRDSQRERLYRWESGLAHGPALDLEACRALVEKAYQAFGYRNVPEVRDGRGRRTASGGPSLVALPVWARTDVTVLHEAAHGIVTLAYGCGQVAPHGPEFARVLIDLLERFTGLRGLTRPARAAGLRVIAGGAAMRRPLGVRQVARIAEIERELLALRTRVTALENERTGLRGVMKGREL